MKIVRDQSLLSTSSFTDIRLLIRTVKMDLTITDMVQPYKSQIRISKICKIGYWRITELQFGKYLKFITDDFLGSQASPVGFYRMLIFSMVVSNSNSPTSSLVDSFSSTSLIISLPCQLWVRRKTRIIVLDMVRGLVTDLELLGQ